MLRANLDEALAAEGFKRPAKGVAYIRAVDSGKQRIEFYLMLRPNWAKDSIVLSLHTSLQMPEVAETARSIRAEAELSGPLPDLVDRQLLATLVRNPPPMTFRAPADLDRYVPWLEGYLRERVLPYLDARRTVRGFAEGGGFRGGRETYGVAAFLVLGERDRARAYLEAACPSDSPYRPGLAAEFAAIADPSTRTADDHDDRLD
ncbi:hypothetical protein PT015_00760 [Candidatus Mycobacterium wuenschmannii]|uniref:DUF4304 domain-containing protein n=1 Tax=Candidatus Mycobacterium wuenschmannii TaxID=3027808 RepID=A0ABY8VXS4_9MYCO|nr:hypothetical protein [Candidatus Mycobacterium wuenschmannii]WIM88096.1 hypothetical protein PT015_00760 [Candidatus Mycobacterium wuenschmannii]